MSTSSMKYTQTTRQKRLKTLERTEEKTEDFRVTPVQTQITLFTGLFAR